MQTLGFLNTLFSIFIPICGVIAASGIKSLSNDSGRAVFWGDSLCLMSIGSSISLFSLIYIRFIELSKSGVSSGGFLIFLLPVLLVLVYFILFIFSNLCNKWQRIGFANCVGLCAPTLHIFVCLVYERFLDRVLLLK